MIAANISDPQTTIALMSTTKSLHEIQTITKTYPSGHVASFDVVCGKFYIPLAYPEKNVSNYKIPQRGGWSAQDTDVWTRWYKLRINPVTLVVHTGDFSFTKSTGLCCHTSHKPTGMTHIPYATARGCNAPLEQDGRANIDLRQTPFAVADNFQFGGCLAAGDWEKRDNDQVVAMTGGGYCGWACPKSVTYDDNFRPLDLGGWHLQLKLVN
eukprot:TRINITY_DN2123_c0_g1_i2.p1 TRINITY_DN2123_c0_g1~~TRINITY_DN2123_c0_g1_i2.p1  ORF type:complete len:211 (+),score=25.33 TRINITY_DN2123_c0_g1_i2:126-758(+)